MQSSPNPELRQRRRAAEVEVAASTASNISTRSTSYKASTPWIKFVFPLLVCFRILNALCVKTFFQPDEYFQALEPAWQTAFGSQSGAWITWEWQYRLRSSLHPVIFGGVYSISEMVMEGISMVPRARASVLIALPKILQGVFAAIGDYFTWKLAERIYGPEHAFASTGLVMTLMSPWQWFCSTRTLSNSLEVVLTAVALSLWPWGMPGPLAKSNTNQVIHAPISVKVHNDSEILRLRLCLVLAGFACVLRPTNLLIWLSLVAMIVMRACQRLYFKDVHNLFYSEIALFLREVVLCGTTVLGISSISDRHFYGIWTFPPYQWLNFNITQSVAIFYGTNDWHYYLSQGLPLLLTTYLPFAVQAIVSFTSKRQDSLEVSSNVTASSKFYRTGEADLIFVVITMVTALSLISHKEVRFIYPLLPCLHVLAAPYLLSFFAVLSQPREVADCRTLDIATARVSLRWWRIPLCILLVITNMTIGLYTTQVHQRGVINVLTFLRYEYENVQNLRTSLVRGDKKAIHTPWIDHAGDDSSEIFAGFLMPCHSTPWRSHLVYSQLKAWALTCEPPLHIPASSPERASYRDEADRFYDDTGMFLRTEMNTTERQWPRYLIGFEGIGSSIESYYKAEMPNRKLRERWRGFNSHWHDDSRRHGDVVVWDFVDI